MSVIIRPGQLLRRIQVRDPQGNPVPVQAPPPPPPPPAPPPVDTNRLLVDAMASVQEAVQDLEERRRQNLAELQEAAIELAVAAASQIVGQALDHGVFGVDQVVASLLGRMTSDGPVQIAMNPLDLKLLKAKRAEGMETPGGVIEFFEDPALKRGCCRANSGSRAVVSDWRTHLAEIRAGLHEELEHAQTERRGPEAAHQHIKRYPDRRETA
ncbi:FliH/SctL family protein [Caulifigura coniformis]|uniref:FliH/SctL family protein n=1 Tax=Caulifigura coniformis TaxID=2527983 RepID=UPI00119FFE12|nr:FliH/SctL family protein [Caulifigura coniformis]